MNGFLDVLDGGLASSIQDLGRRGYQRFGISESGALDPAAMRIANAMAGNPAETATVEMTLSGATFRVEAGRCRMAVAGAALPVAVNGEPCPGDRSFDVAAGDVVRFGTAAAGMRAYLAVAGGFDLPPALGSLSTHTRSRLGGLGGRFLRAGDRLALRGVAAPPGPHLRHPGAAVAAAGIAASVRVLLGPQQDAFTEGGIQTFLSQPYTVTARSDRMGYQLAGPPVAHRDGFNIVSDGIVNGSIQVPGNGQPIVLLADRQTTGGYPKIATVIEPDLALVAQRRPGETISFVAVGPDEAMAAVRQARADLEASLAGLVEAGRRPSEPTTRWLLSQNLVSGIYRG